MKATFIVLASLALAASAEAATIITTNTPTGNVTPQAGSSYVSLVNSSGLSATVSTGMDTASALAVTQLGTAATADTYVTGSTGGGTDYFVAGGTVPVLTFTLGGIYDNIDSIILWNYVNLQNTTTQFSLSFFSDALATTQIGSTITGLSATADLTNAQQIFFGGGGTVDFDGVQAIQMALTDNSGGNRVGLGEVRFSQQAVPEPSRLVLLGLASIGLIWRRRR
ncbi:MAG: PEP-CTERM sorting domain-containing protein [Verrucomicrobiales bacterium]|nr:PEP-CTERM sorting domain-containing protein [Verrucomicrobiales bacterium]MCP5559545.1 PEP-CTERM sorting domain-containing protein [Verrucomicrobiaceae bacterium]